MPSYRFLLLASVLAAPALAQQAPTDNGLAQQAPGSDELVVTAVRTPTPVNQIASSITVLDRAAIDASQQYMVSDLIVRTPGVTASRTGGFGTTTGVRIRGAEGDQTVVVIDGVKLNDPSAPGGGYDFGDLFIGDAAQVEVLRGPQSTLWGSQAIGGVVNIVTQLPKSGFQGGAQAEGGSRGTASGRANIGGSQNGISWELAGNAFRTSGISQIAPEFGGHERDGYHHYGTSGRILANLSEDVSLDLRGYWSHGKVDLDSSFGPPDVADYQKQTNWTGYAGLNFSLFGGALKNRIGLTRDQIDRDNFDPTIVSGDDRTFIAHGRNDHLEYQGDLALAKGWNAIFGAEHEHSRFNSISPQFQTDPDHGNVSIDSVYGQLTGSVVEHLTLTGGARYDHHQTYGGHALLSGGAVWSSGGTTIRASYGEGFKAPTLYQLYGEFGNLDLDPERAHGWDAGIEQKFGGYVTASLTYFDRDTHNLVEFAGFPPRADRPFGYYQNVDKANAHGVEAAAVARFGGLSLDANYTWTDAEDRSPGATYGNDLIRRPHDTANADITYVWAFGLATTVAVTHASHAYEDGGNTIRLGGYTLVDFSVEQPIGHGLSLFGRVENVGNTHYETAYQYGTLGRSFYGGVRAKF
jgi:vitamin B12 transporter